MKNNSPITSLSPLRLAPGSLRLALYALPPFHLLYLYAVAREVGQASKGRQKPLLPKILAVMAVCLLLSSFVLVNVLGIYMKTYLQDSLFLFLYGILCLYLAILFHLTRITVQYERRQSSERYFDFTDMDYRGELG